MPSPATPSLLPPLIDSNLFPGHFHRRKCAILYPRIQPPDMKKATLSLLFSCLILTAIAQNDSASESFLRKKFYSEYITLSEKQPAQDSLAWFSQISVIDLRKDTSRIGLSGTRYTRRQMFFHTNASNTIQTWLRGNYIHGADKRSLLVAIKDLWLFDSEEELTEGQRELPASALPPGSPFSG